MDQNQMIALAVAILIAILLWYSMNPPKKEKCCGMV